MSFSLAWRVVLVGLQLGSLAGCVAVEGGAIEAAWVINAAVGGVRISCECAQITSVDIVVVPQSGTDTPCAGDDCRFSCRRGVGTTRFAISEGNYVISLAGVDSSGVRLTAAEGLTTPPPIVREVRRGELTNLGVYLLIADTSRLASPPTCDAQLF